MISILSFQTLPTDDNLVTIQTALVTRRPFCFQATRNFALAVLLRIFFLGKYAYPCPEFRAVSSFALICGVKPDRGIFFDIFN